MTSRGRGKRTRQPLRISALRLTVIGGLCLLITALGVYHLVSQALPRRVEGDWQVIAKSKDPERLERVARRAKETLNARPMDVRAASLLAMARDAQGRPREAEALMRAAFKLSRRDTATNLWLFSRDVDQGRYDEAFLNIDAYMRRYPNESAKVMPSVVSAAARPGAGPIFAQRLAAKPGWRRGFYDTLTTLTPNNPDAAFSFMSESLKRGGPPTRDELEIHLSRMVAAGRYEEAYLHWILLIPNDQASKVGYINDGDFEGDGGYPPFGWNLAKAPSATVESAQAYGRKGKALRLGYDGFEARPLPTQVMLLPPGQYRMTADYLTEDKDSVGRVKWMISCPGEPPRILGERINADTNGGWVRFHFDFTIPESGCPAQVIGAVAVPGVRRVPVGVWIDRVLIARTDAPS